MPLTKCTDNGKSGWRWGSQGKCYTGPEGKVKALKQGYAENPDHFKEEMGKASNHFDREVLYMAKAIINEDERSEAKIRYDGEKYYILGQGDFKFDTYEEAVEFQYGTSNVPPALKTNRKAKKKEGFYDDVKKKSNDNYNADVDQSYGEDICSTYGYVSKEERDSTSKEDFADPEHEKYPIKTKKHLESAIKLYGRSKDLPPETVKKNIIKIAKRKGWEANLPEDWK